MKKEQRAKRTHRQPKTKFPGGVRFSNNDAADYLGVNHGTLAKWRCIGEPFIPYYKIGKKVTYDQDDLDRHRAQHRVDRLPDTQS